MKRKIFKDKKYTHLDVKKHYEDYEDRVKSVKWVSHHGFYPFIHFTLNFDKYVDGEEGKHLIPKKREIYYSSHIDRYIYEYYGNKLNDAYNKYTKKNGIGKTAVSIGLIQPFFIGLIQPNFSEIN